MLLSLLIAIIIAKINKLEIRPAFQCWWLSPIVLVECIYIVFQGALSFGNYSFLPYAQLLKTLSLYIMILPILRYQLYKPAVVGSVLILVGTLMNKIVMAANGGLMPVYPTLSKLTGYFTADPLGNFDKIHSIGDASTRLKFLTDYIDLGYSVLSPGDVLVHLFTVIILYYTIKQLNTQRTN